MPRSRERATAGSLARCHAASLACRRRESSPVGAAIATPAFDIALALRLNGRWADDGCSIEASRLPPADSGRRLPSVARYLRQTRRLPLVADADFKRLRRRPPAAGQMPSIVLLTEATLEFHDQRRLGRKMLSGRDMRWHIKILPHILIYYDSRRLRAPPLSPMMIEAPRADAYVLRHTFISPPLMRHAAPSSSEMPLTLCRYRRARRLLHVDVALCYRALLQRASRYRHDAIRSPHIYCVTISSK